MTTVLKSNLDKSINYITKSGNSFVESRFVQRNEDYIIVYLSSHNGCNQSCRFCHLTQTGQTEEVDVTLEGYLEQASQVLNSVVFDNKIKKVHFNFMARGEPLNNKWFVKNSSLLFTELTKLVPDNIDCKFLVSSIIPKGLEDDLAEIFADKRSKLYYSMYSVDKTFRKRWLPKARDVEYALQSIWCMEKMTHVTPVIHYAFIKGENDSVEAVYSVCRMLKKYSVSPDFNIVRYNPHSEKCGEETDYDTIVQLAEIFKECFPTAKVKIVGKVGFDVKASCGMFVEGEIK